MPAYLCHGFRWDREKIRAFMNDQKLASQLAEDIMCADSSRIVETLCTKYADILPDEPLFDMPRDPAPPCVPVPGQTQRENRFDTPKARVPHESDPVLRHTKCPFKLLEEYDADAETPEASPYAFLADYVVRVDLDVNVSDEVRRYVRLCGHKGDRGWFKELRDTIDNEEQIRWYMVVNNKRFRLTRVRQAAPEASSTSVKGKGKMRPFFNSLSRGKKGKGNTTDSSAQRPKGPPGNSTSRGAAGPSHSAASGSGRWSLSKGSSLRSVPTDPTRLSVERASSLSEGRRPYRRPRELHKDGSTLSGTTTTCSPTCGGSRPAAVQASSSRPSEANIRTGDRLDPAAACGQKFSESPGKGPARTSPPKPGCSDGLANGGGNFAKGKGKVDPPLSLPRVTAFVPPGVEPTKNAGRVVHRCESKYSEPPPKQASFRRRLKGLDSPAVQV